MKSAISSMEYLERTLSGFLKSFLAVLLIKTNKAQQL